MSSLVHLVLFQIVAVMYSIMGPSTILKARYGSKVPSIFATDLRDYGVFLMVIPIAWIIHAMTRLHRPRKDAGNICPELVLGLVILGVLVLLGFIGTSSAISYRHGSIVIAGDE